MKPSNTLSVRPRSRIATVFLLILAIAAGIASRMFPTHLPLFLHKNAGDILWATALYALLITISTRSFPGRAMFLTFLLAAGVEALKLYHTPWLDTFRESTIGGLIFGHVFSWSNIGCYAIGSILGLILDAVIAWRPGSRKK